MAGLSSSSASLVVVQFEIHRPSHNHAKDPIHANFIAFLPREPRLKRSPYAPLRRPLDVHAFRDGPLRNR